VSQSVFILGASADIGQALAGMYADAGAQVVATYRSRAGVAALEGRANVRLLPCDVGSRESIRAMLDAYAALNPEPWDLFISAVGSMEPIGPWTSLDFDAWEASVTVNALAQLRVLHGLYPRRRPGLAHAAFFAGGGTNNPFTNYSAYCVSKIMLIKMCELLDDEVPDLNAFIIGPGFLPTKIHAQTFANPSGAGKNVDKTRQFFDAPGRVASYADLYDCINWCIAGGREVMGGRNLSAVYDPWKDSGPALADALRHDGNRYKLRRAGNTGPTQGAGQQ
jgi:NAD(P)-dependent dehydrogenase (short-subunit alcohol dehydrogenase family)